MIEGIADRLKECRKNNNISQRKASSPDVLLDHNGLTSEQIELVQNLIKDMKRK